MFNELKKSVDEDKNNNKRNESEQGNEGYKRGLQLPMDPLPSAPSGNETCITFFPFLFKIKKNFPRFHYLSKYNIGGNCMLTEKM